MTETRFYEPARLSTPPKPLFSLKLLDADLVEVMLSKVFREAGLVLCGIALWGCFRALLAITRLRRELGKIRLPKTIPYCNLTQNRPSLLRNSK